MKKFTIIAFVLVVAWLQAALCEDSVINARPAKRADVLGSWESIKITMTQPARAKDAEGMKQWITFNPDNTITMRMENGKEYRSNTGKLNYMEDGIIEPVIEGPQPKAKILWRCSIEGEILKINIDGIGVMELKRIKQAAEKPEGMSQPGPEVPK